jgi:hypothetical protein
LRETLKWNLQQEEALETAGVDRDRTAIGDVVDGKSVEGRAVVQRIEIRPACPERLEIMRTEDPPDLFGRPIDRIGGDAGKGREPLCAARPVETGIPNDRFGHLSNRLPKLF